MKNLTASVNNSTLRLWEHVVSLRWEHPNLFQKAFPKIILTKNVTGEGWGDGNDPWLDTDKDLARHRDLSGAEEPKGCGFMFNIQVTL